jgi:hypothetical protein
MEYLSGCCTVCAEGSLSVTKCVQAEVLNMVALMDESGPACFWLIL